MEKYRIKTPDGEKIYEADCFEVKAGTLTLLYKTSILAAFAPGEWLQVEPIVEIKEKPITLSQDSTDVEFGHRQYTQDEEAIALAKCYRLLLEKAAERRARLAKESEDNQSTTS